MNTSTDRPPSANGPRRSGPSTRQMTFGRRLSYRLGVPIVRLVLRLLWSTYRVKTLPHQPDILRTAPSPGTAPCYWHQHHVLCGYLVRRWLARGFRGAFLISDSVDGEVPARIAAGWGATAIRGSANRTGTHAMRQMRELGKQGIGIVSTADGPLGPKAEFKAGVALMAKLNQAKMLPLSCAAASAWYLKRWDQFMIPKPFSRVVVAIGEPVPVADGIAAEQLAPRRDEMQAALDKLQLECENFIKNSN